MISYMITSINRNNDQIYCIMCLNKNILKNTSKISLNEGVFWSSKLFFLEKLKMLENMLVEEHSNIKCDNMDCTLCAKKNVSTYYFVHNKYLWDNSLYHYVDVHNVKPPSRFIQFVLYNDPTIKYNCGTLKIANKQYNQTFTYVKIKTNQLLMMDGLMEHGGIKPRYIMRHNEGFKYAEHAGMLDFKDGKLIHIILTGDIGRMSKGDPEIFFSNFGESSYEYEYIFHTHPATPTPGGRAVENSLYEFPSAIDIIHFIHHFNKGALQGSLVITPEGIYNIRKYHFNRRRIRIDDSIKNKYKKAMGDIQDESIDKYGIEFSVEYFYSVIARDMTPINKLNDFLHQFGLHIDFFPRQKAANNEWIMGTIYLPICV